MFLVAAAECGVRQFNLGGEVIIVVLVVADWVVLLGGVHDPVRADHGVLGPHRRRLGRPRARCRGRGSGRGGGRGRGEGGQELLLPQPQGRGQRFHADVGRLGEALQGVPHEERRGAGEVEAVVGAVVEGALEDLGLGGEVVGLPHRWPLEGGCGHLLQCRGRDLLHRRGQSFHASDDYRVF